MIILYTIYIDGKEVSQNPSHYKTGSLESAVKSVGDVVFYNKKRGYYQINVI